MGIQRRREGSGREGQGKPSWFLAFSNRGLPLAARLVAFAACAAAFAGAGCGTSKSRGFSNDDTFGQDGGTPQLGDAACAATSEAGKGTPLNLFVMFDKSSSQVGTKWDAAKAGLAVFVNDPKSAGIRAALGFFPRAPDGTAVCDQRAYATPRVPFDVLPQNAGAITTAINQETPDGANTPIYPALGGAILGALDQTRSRPGEAGAVLLVTDGEPTGPAPLCNGVNPEDAGEIAKIAQAGVGSSPQVRTFVIGLPGVSSSIANQIAVAGGTQQAFIVAGSNVQADFQVALEKVRGNALPCDYELPQKLADKSFAYDKVNVVYTKLGSPKGETLPQSLGCSSGEGWRYDDAKTPTRIVLCGATCSRIKADGGGKVQVLLGCDTVIR